MQNATPQLFFQQAMVITSEAPTKDTSTDIITGKLKGFNCFSSGGKKQ